MARIGLKFPVFAEIVSETFGKTPTYGEGFYIGKAISAEKNIESNSNPLYGDDAIAENDTSFASGTLTLGVTDFGTSKDTSFEIQAKLLGHQIVNHNGVQVLRRGGGDKAPTGGFGYIKTKIINKETHYEVTWLYKTQFQEFSESTNTKGSSIEWQTPTITGTIMLVEGMDKDTWEDTAIFPTLSQARTWLESMANITSNVVKTQLISAISEAEGKDPEAYTSASYADMYVALLNAKAVNNNTYAGQNDVDDAKTALNNTMSALSERS